MKQIKIKCLCWSIRRIAANKFSFSERNAMKKARKCSNFSGKLHSPMSSSMRIPHSKKFGRAPIAFCWGWQNTQFKRKRNKKKCFRCWMNFFCWTPFRNLTASDFLSRFTFLLKVQWSKKNCFLHFAVNFNHLTRFGCALVEALFAADALHWRH